MPSEAIVWIVLVLLFLAAMIVRWVVAAAGLGKAVHDSAKHRQTRKSEDEQFRNLTS